jgi:hypothetical protein
MPFDMSPAKDDLSDIDVSKPLSVKSIRRIVRATRQAGLLAMDDPMPHLLRLTLDPTEIHLFPPHQAVDAFLGAEHREELPVPPRRSRTRLSHEAEQRPSVARALSVYRAGHARPRAARRSVFAAPGWQTSSRTPRVFLGLRLMRIA